MARYRIDPERSMVTIDAKSSLHPIHSTTDGLEGFVDLEFGPDGAVDVDAGTAAELQLEVSRLQSGNRMEDREMQRRIDARRYPTIDGKLDRLEHAGTDGQYRVSGDVTFRGVSRTHRDQMTIRQVDDRTIELAGKSRFNIKDFGMEPPRILILSVAPEVDVGVDIVAIKEA